MACKKKKKATISRHDNNIIIITGGDKSFKREKEIKNSDGLQDGGRYLHLITFVIILFTNVRKRNNIRQNTMCYVNWNDRF